MALPSHTSWTTSPATTLALVPAPVVRVTAAVHAFHTVYALLTAGIVTVNGPAPVNLIMAARASSSPALDVDSAVFPVSGLVSQPAIA